jgi:hypothetical protein
MEKQCPDCSKSQLATAVRLHAIEKSEETLSAVEEAMASLHLNTIEQPAPLCEHHRRTRWQKDIETSDPSTELSTLDCQNKMRTY